MDQNNKQKLLDQFSKLTDQQQKDTVFFMYENLPCAIKEKLDRILSAYLKSQERVQSSTDMDMSGMTQEEVKAQTEEILNTLEKINEEDCTLHGTLEQYYGYSNYYDYDDYNDYNDDDDENITYEDSEGVIEKISRAILFANDCFQNGYYQDALDLYDCLWDLNILLEMDEYDSNLTIDDLVDDKLLIVNMTQMAEQTLYADYQVRQPDERAENMYRYFVYPAFRDINVEKALQSGKQTLKQLDLFWNDWIFVLTEKEGEMETRLLREAALSCGGMPFLEKVAEKNYKLHPQLVLDVMDGYRQNGCYKEMEICGEHAAKQMNPQYCIRSQIIKQTILACEYQNKKYEEGAFWQEIFASDSTIKNLLLFFAADPKRAKEYSVYKRENELEEYRNNRELSWNKIDTDKYIPLRLLTGEFDEAATCCKDFKKVVGWSGSFMKKTLALFLLFLYQGETLRTATDKLIEEIRFDEEEPQTNLERQICKESEEKNEKMLWLLLKKWKTQYPMDSDQMKKHLVWIRQMMDARANEILRNTYRGKYGETAMYLCAIGEVEESLGTMNAKLRIQQEYKAKFPRHRAFQSEMTAFCKG